MGIHRIGSHSLHIDGDVVHLQWVGDLLPQDITDMCAHVEAMFEKHSVVFAIADARATQSIGREARRRAAEWPHAHRVGCMAFIGASLTVRTAITIIQAIVKVFGRVSLIPVTFVDTEEEARAWIDARRCELDSRRAPTSQ